MKTTFLTLACFLSLAGAASADPLPMGSPAGAPAAAQGGSSLSAEEAGVKAEVILRDVEAWVSEYEGTARGGSDGAACPPGFNMRSYLRDRREKRGEREIGADVPDPDGRAKMEWEYYNVCSALAAKSEAPCSDIAEVVRPDAQSGGSVYAKGAAQPVSAAESFTSFSSQKDKCVEGYRLERVKIAYLARDPNFLSVCKEAGPYLPPMKSPASLDAICAAWKDASGDLGALTAAIMSGVRTPLKREFAAEAAREMVSDPGWCSSTTQTDAKLSCTELNDYRSAAAKRDPKACRGGLCRMLLGGGAASCEPYALKVKKHLCANFYGVKYSNEKTAVIEGRLKEAETLLAGAAKNIGDLRQAQAFTARLDRVYELRDRVARAEKTLGPVGKGTKTPGKAPVKGSKTQ